MINSDLEEILQVVADATKTSIKAFADGYQFNDLFSFVPVFAEIPAAIKDAKKGWEYLNDLSEEKENEILDSVAEKLKDTSEAVRETARLIIRALAADYMLIKHLMKKSAPPDGGTMPK